MWRRRTWSKGVLQGRSCFHAAPFQKRRFHCPNFGLAATPSVPSAWKEAASAASDYQPDLIWAMPRPKRSTELQTNRASQQRKITDSGLRTTKRRAKKSDEHHLKIAKQEILESPDRPNTLEEAPDKDEDILGMQSDSERKIYPDPDVDKRQKTRRLAGPRQIRSECVDFWCSISDRAALSLIHYAQYTKRIFPSRTSYYANLISITSSDPVSGLHG